MAASLLLTFLTAPTARTDGGTIVASDSFNRADENPFSVTGNWGRVIAGNYDGNSALVNNEVTAVSNEGIYYWKGSGTFDPTRQFARQRVVQKDGELGLVLLGGADQAIMVAWGPPGVNNTLYIYWYANGTNQSVLSQSSSTINNGDIIEAVLDGGVIYAKVNGVTVHSVANTTTLTTGTPGFITYLDVFNPQFVSKLDDWEAGTPSSYTISGTVTEDSTGLPGVLVSASGGFSGSGTTDANGNYTITGVAPGATSILLTPTLSGHTMSPTTRTVAGPVTADVAGQDFTSASNTGTTLTVHATHGTVTRDPDQASYTLGTVVTLTPVPDGGYAFASWSGNVPVGHETDNPLQLTMDQDRIITAHFTSESVTAADNFNRANETPFATGGNWQRALTGGTANLASQHVAGSSGDALYYWQGPGSFSGTRQFARASIVSSAGQVGLVLLGANNRGLVTAWNAGTLYIYWYNAGAYMGNLTTLSSTLQAGDEIEALLDGGRVYVKINGAIVANVANTTTLGAGTPGFETFESGGALDNWEAGTPPSFDIGGTITENAAGLAGVQVTASGGYASSTTTDGNGVYTFSGVPEGVTSVTLTPTLFGHSMSPTTRTVTGPLTDDVTGQDFTATLNSGAILTVNASHGTVTKNPDQPSYAFGTIVTLTPAPDGGYAFSSWSGDVPVGHETDNPLQVTMDQNRTITAAFESVGVGAADDFNRANETPFATGGNWQRALTGGTANLASQHVAGSSGDALYYWQGAGGFSGTRQFARASVVSSAGQVGLVLLGANNRGLVTAWNGGTLYVYWYNAGAYMGNLTTLSSTVQAGDEIEAVLDGGRVYAKVNGAIVANVANTTTLGAGTPGFETFESGGALDNWEAGTPPSYAISGTILENGGGLSGVQVTASGGFSASTSTDGAGYYTLTGISSGTTSVTVTPVLAGHTMTPTSRTVNGPINADVPGQDFTSTVNTGVTLTVNASHGSVTKNPDQASYALGTLVTLTPIPDGGYAFSGWSGDVPAGHEADNPLQVTMDQNRTITASFAFQGGGGASDDFNRANETPFVTGGNWLRALTGGTANLVSQHVSGSSGDALYYWQGPGSFSPTSQYARASVVSGAGQVGLVLLGASNRGLVTAWNGGTLFVYWYTGGSYMGNLTTASSTVQAGDQIEAVLDGGRVYVRINGALVVNVANTTTLGAGTPGFETFESGGALDNWEGGTPPSYAISGTILEDGNGLSGVQVTASGGFSGSTTTDGAGYYTLTGVPGGTTSVTVTPSLAGHTMSPTSRTIAGPITADVPGQDFTSTANTGASLTINASHGTVTRNPDLPLYPFDSDVLLTPVPDAGYTFASWSGDVPAGHESDNPLTLTMSQDRTVTAHFAAADVIASDDFNRANEIPFATGGNWQRALTGGTAKLFGQHVEGTAGDALYYWQGPGGFDATLQFARASVVSSTGTVGLVLLGANGQGIVTAWNGGTLFIYWYTGSAYQGNLRLASSTLQPGDTIEARLDNGIVYAKVNGTVVTSVANTTTLSTGTPGFETFESGGALDNWEAGPPSSTCTGLPDGTACDDGNACSASSTCQGGLCVGSASCDDGNPCTVDSCNPNAGCQHAAGNAGATCRAAAGQCDVAETCTGSSSVCPADAFATSATTCTGASQAGACDATDHCSGTANTCVDEFQPGGFVCRAAVDGCDAAETCTGSSGTCPADAPAPGLGVACDGPDSDLCNEGVTVCTAGTITCNDTSSDNLDLCNGVDDDCDPASADGSEDPGVGAACDGPDSDLCIEGVTTCVSGALACGDTTGGTVDLCNGVDDDCDPASADGSEDPGVVVACDGPDSDLCTEGTTVCTGGAISCSDATGDNLDICNGLDDDCDPASADGSEDPSVGAACDGPDSDLCIEGVTTCVSGALACSDTTGSTVDLCNGVDDDCDPASADGSEDPGVGVACDGPDSDLCAEGTTVCSGGAISCSDATGDNLDVCNGLDDDCDPASADGSEDPGVGIACDGPDSDLCIEGATICAGGSVSCGDTTGSTLDLCNGLDDDCDPSSADGSEDPGVGIACDGPDSDLCAEGVTACVAGGIACSDTTGSTFDLCNGVDDDCDPASADGSEDPGVGGTCDGPDSDLCLEGVRACTAGSITCTDTTGSTVDLCNGVDDDCDPLSVDGSEDPGVGGACDGPDSDLCLEGVRLCAAGSITCTDVTGSTVDLCNGLDDDCDPASVDGSEDPSVNIACDGPDTDLCLEGVSSCTAGAVVCSDNTTSNVEICNGLDDNCNGVTDENGSALCDDGNSCNGTEVCAGAGGCQAGTPPAVASRISIPDTITAASGGTLIAPVLADVAAGTMIQLVVTYNPAVLQPLGVDKSLITASATVTTNLLVSGQVQVSILAPAPLQGAGALVYVRFQVVGAAGSSATLGLPTATVDGGLVTSCHDSGQAAFCSTANQEVTGLLLSGKTNTTVSWTKITGGGHRYDLASGTLADLRSDRSALDAACVADSITQDVTNDGRPNPAVGTGLYYLVRMQDACAKGTYGNSSRGDLRWTAVACP